MRLGIALLTQEHQCLVVVFASFVLERALLEVSFNVYESTARTENMANRIQNRCLTNMLS